MENYNEVVECDSQIEKASSVGDAFTMEEHMSSMTITYYKRTGEIYSCGTGIQDMNLFGKYKQDYTMIMDCLVMPIDRFVLENTNQFVVDTKNKELLYNPKSVKNYRMYKEGN